ncbi:Cellulase (glycosyl hydrolase family 5) [Nocardioides scoriae]|uniref:Cellulase (Glycosyl hydrolase family 5) n=1 Tax=Nocardioides scoriae TaxID=642780 RepID=A0A1H1X2H2_9ACTN|nr:cellulase family glycosylhydrolase [Nocardioides scoriae]SDT02826.1 Cellulase (glycosyl hydrolase family 5) [Nocardioides scoriae]
MATVDRHPGRALTGALALLAAALVLGVVLGPRTGTPVGADGSAREPGLPVGVSFGERLTRASPAELATALDDVVALGARWVRLDVSWPTIQPVSADQHDWAALDRVVAEAQQRDLDVLGVVTWSAPWVRDPGCTTFTCPPASAASYAVFAGEVAQRYRGRIAAYEIWNEPNLDLFWVAPDPRRYRELLTGATLALQQGDPDAQVLMGGLAANDRREGVVDAGDFLRVACSGGACRGLDGVAYHPYTYPRTPTDPAVETPWQRMTRSTRQGPALDGLMSAAGIDPSALWVTEYGAPTGGASTDGSPTGAVDEAQQARILAAGVRAAAAAPQVRALMLYTWRDLETGGTVEDHFGLRRLDGSQKPAWEAVRRAVADTSG